jgi:DNA-directed RNA polymerase omega subunit
MGELISINKGRDFRKGRGLMEDVSYLTEALRVIPNRYQLVKVISERVRQLNKGAKPLVNIDESHYLSLVEIACKEIVQGKLKLETPILGAKKGKKKESRGV